MVDFTFEDVAADMLAAGRPQKVGVGQLIALSWRSLREHGGRIWPAAAALAFVQMVMGLGAQLLGMDLAHPAMDWSVVVFFLASAAPTAVISAGVVRTILGRTEDAWSLDGEALAYIGLVMAGAAIMALMLAAMLPPPGGQSAPPAELAAYGLKVIGVMLASGVLGYVSVRLALWPLGFLMSEPELSLGRAWSCMKGAFFAYLIATFVMALGPGFLGGFVGGLFKAHPNAVATAIARGFTQLSSLAALLVTAELYRLRVGDVQRLGEVFE